MLLVASYYFYARWNAWYVLFLWILTASDFADRDRARASARSAAGAIRGCCSRLGVAANLAFLGSFKYTNFASGTVAALIGMHENPWLVNLFVPIGISFHTFQSISYLVDVYRGKHGGDPQAARLRALSGVLSAAAGRADRARGTLLRRALRVAAAGPRRRQLRARARRLRFGEEDGDRRSVRRRRERATSVSIASHPGAPAAWSALFAFGMQIYFDFSGYSDIAIGCARLFGFVFPENFRDAVPGDEHHRFLASLAHHALDVAARLSLHSAGRQPHGKLATLRNLMLTMLLGGLWHGAQWTFVAWGGFHGVMLCVERVVGIGHERTRRAASCSLRVVYVLRRLAGAGCSFARRRFASLAVYRCENRLATASPAPSAPASS